MIHIRLRSGFVGAACLLLAAFDMPVVCERPARHAQGSVTPAGLAAQKEKGAEQKGMQRDRMYNKLLKSTEAFQAVLKQQPGNTPALERYVGILEEELTALRETVGRKSDPATKKAGEAARVEAKQGATGAPAGPAQPGKQGTRPEDIAKGRKATLEGTYLPGPPLKQAPKTLAGVPDDWIRSQTELAEKKLKEISNLLKGSEADLKKLPDAVAKLHEIIAGMATPPKNKPVKQPSKEG